MTYNKIDNVLKVQKFFEKEKLSKKSILLVFEVFEKGIIRKIKDSISSRAFENLFFRQFYFLIKNNKIELFIEGLNFLINNKKLIIKLLNYYHYELIFRDYLEWKIIFRNEIYSFLEENIQEINKLNLKFNKWISELYRLNLFTINSWNKKIDIYLKMDVLNNELDLQDWQNSISLNIYTRNKKIFNLSFYIWKDTILISNVQWMIGVKKYNFISSYSKILLYILLHIAIKLNILTIISFSNKNHPCKFHNLNEWFRWDYDNILKNIWMELKNDWYLHWNINNLEVKWLNVFVKENIDYNIENIYKVLKI